MRSTAKRVLIGTGIVAGAAALLFAMFAWKFGSETALMSPAPTGMAVEGVFAVKDGLMNVYFMRSEVGYAAFDAGNDAENLRLEMKKLAIDPGQVKAVFLTHTDNDHVAGLKIFTSAKVYISRPEVQMIDGTRRRMFVFHNGNIPAYETLEDGQAVHFGGIEIKAILTPGHTPGSACYLVNGRHLFTGDTLSLKNGTVEPFNDFFNMDTETEKKSLHKIAVLPGVVHVFTAHYGFTDNAARALGKWVK